MKEDSEKSTDLETAGWKRRVFLKKALCSLAGISSGAAFFPFFSENGQTVLAESLESPQQRHPVGRKQDMLLPTMETTYYTKLKDKKIRCRTCFRKCIVAPDKRGFCRSRINIDGTYYSLTYGRPSALQIDPVEKEPSYHLHPGMSIFSMGTACCTNRCKFCHNWHLSQTDIYDINFWEIPPEGVVVLAKKNQCGGLSFTYNEPTVFFEFMYDVMRIGKKEGLKSLFHTNGGMAPGPLSDLLTVSDAVTVDLKAFTETFYRSVSSSELSPVLETLKLAAAAPVHLEIVNLVIPSLNDDMGDIARMCRFIKRELGDTIPLHFTRFFPSYKLRNLPPTPVSTLEKARKIATEEVGLKFVYIGNVPGHKYNSTFCPNCGKVIIKRRHFEVWSNHISNGRCGYCDIKIPGVWS